MIFKNRCGRCNTIIESDKNLIKKSKWSKWEDSPKDEIEVNSFFGYKYSTIIQIITKVRWKFWSFVCPCCKARNIVYKTYERKEK